MKKYFYFLFFFTVFANAVIQSDPPTCPVGQSLIEGSRLITAPASNYLSCPTGYPHWVVNSPNISYVFSTSCEKTSSYPTYSFQITTVYYTCRTTPVCPTDTAWDVLSQTCKKVCKPYQRNDLLTGECVDMCYPLDTYEPGLGGLNALFPNDPLSCKNPALDSVDKDTCENTDGYTYSCFEYDPDNNFMQKLLTQIIPIYPTTTPGKHCRCINGNKMPMLSVSLPSVKLPRLSDIDEILQPFPKLLEALKKDDALAGLLPNILSKDGVVSEDIMQLYKNLEDFLESSSASTLEVAGKSYDYIDTLIVETASGLKYEPTFNVTTPATGTTPVISANGYENLTSANSTYSAVNSVIPSGLQVTPSVYTQGYVTATKTNLDFLIPTVVEGSTTSLTISRPTSVTSTSTVPSTLVLTGVSSVGGVSNYTGVSNGVTYGVTKTVSSNGDVTTDVRTSTTTTTTGGLPATVVESYTYTTTTGGTVINNITNPTTVTTSNGTTTVPSSSTTNYNYNSSTLNLDELLNFTPDVTDTAMTKPFEEMVKAQNDALDFIDSLKNSINGIKLDFDAMMLKLKNPPQIHEKTGNCNLTAVFLGKTIVANPCNAFYPYREMLKLFFIAIGSFFVARFAVENLK